MDNEPNLKEKVSAFFFKFKKRIIAGALAAGLLVPIVGSQIDKPKVDPNKPVEPDHRPGYEQLDPTYNPSMDDDYTISETPGITTPSEDPTNTEKPAETMTPSETEKPEETMPSETTKPENTENTNKVEETTKPIETVNPEENKPTETTPGVETTTPGETAPTETTKPTESQNPEETAPTETTNPTESQNPEETQPGETTNPSDDNHQEENPPEEHIHEFGPWQNNGEGEKRVCNTDGHVEYRNHTLTKPIIKNISNNNGTYTVLTTINCETCDYESITEEIKPCVFGNWTYNSETGLDERTCTITGYKETRTHLHDLGPIINYDSQYEYHSCLNGCGKEIKVTHNLDKGTTNKDGSTTYRCTNEGCSYNYTKTHEITPTPDPTPHTHNQVVNKEYPDTPLEDYCYIEETTCTDCDELHLSTKIPHQLTKSVDPVTHDETYTCTNPECHYTKTIPHTHTLTTKNVFPESPTSTYCYEVVEYCTSCEDILSTKEEEHNMTSHTDANHNTVYTCENPGCNYTYTINHEHQKSTRVIEPTESETDICYKTEEYCEICGEVFSSTPTYHQKDTKKIYPTEQTKNYCYELQEYCTECNKDLGAPTRVKHTYQDEVQDNFDIKHTCTDSECQYTYTEAHEHILEEVETSPDVKVADYCYETKNQCTVCGQTVGDPVKHDHTYTVSEDADHNKTYTCDKCGYTYEEKHVHTKDTRKVLAEEVNDEYCYNVEKYCPECGTVLESTPIPHELEYGDWGKCTMEGCSYEKEAPHFHVAGEVRAEYPEYTTAEYCYIEYTYCQDCHELMSEVKVPHNLDYDNPFTYPWGEIEYSCKDPQCKYTYAEYSEEEIINDNHQNPVATPNTENDSINKEVAQPLETQPVEAPKETTEEPKQQTEEVIEPPKEDENVNEELPKSEQATENDSITEEPTEDIEPEEVEIEITTEPQVVEEDKPMVLSLTKDKRRYI